MTSFKTGITRRDLLIWTGGLLASIRFSPCVSAVSPQPYFAGIRRALETLARLGAPMVADDAQRLADLARQNDDAAVAEAERILYRYTLLVVTTDRDGYAYATAAGAARTLVEQGWRLFLVRVSNAAESTDKLRVSSGIAFPWVYPSAFTQSTGAARAGVPDTLNAAPAIARSWLRAELYEGSPMGQELSGLPVEYRVIQLYSRDAGWHRAQLSFFVTNDQYAEFVAEGYHRGADLDFHCLPSRDVVLRVYDEDGRGCVASLTIRDTLNRIYPPQAMRLAPDMQFQPQIYRADGETVRLPDGEYTVESRRGPEYVVNHQTVMIGESKTDLEIRLRRWINPAKWGWYSGDTHIHAAGCSHYESPTEGVSPETMIRHARGEALSVAEVLTWGPGWYYQKQFFSGHTESPPAELEHPGLQLANNSSLKPRVSAEDAETMLRYDVEVSGFPSSHCGHLVLLRLKDQDYPGSRTIQDWPSWNLPILMWAKGQGAVVGYGHVGLGMMVDSTSLPNYEIPPLDGPGTQEAIVDVTHGLVDFLSGCDTAPVAELNAWYHILNCGFRLAMLGETDFPCLSDSRPGAGRTYVRLERRPVGNAGYESWIRSLQRGRIYCGDGRSHFLSFEVEGSASGDNDVVIKSGARLAVEATVAARLELVPTYEKSLFPYFGWHIEAARIANSRNVVVELVVNGVPIDRSIILADGTPRPLKFKLDIVRSCWVALRILPSAHTYPVFVSVAGRPIRASKRSAQWCQACVEKLWKVSKSFIRESEQQAASDAFAHARKVYGAIIQECDAE